MHRRAFTLIELLVVIAIIALLMGILLPALGQARSAAKATLDLANLRSLGQGLQMYADEQETFPSLRLPRGQTHETTGRPRARWHFAMGDYLGKAPFVPRNAQEAADFLTNDTMPRIDNKVFMDPSHDLEDFRSVSSGTVKALRNGSYGYNYHYLGNTRGEGPGGSPANWPVRQARIQMPAMTIAFADSLGSQQERAASGFREHSYTIDPPRLDTAHNGALSFAQSDGKSPVDTRHLGRASVSFLDGHAQAMSLEDLGYTIVDREQRLVGHDEGDNRLWNGLGVDEDATGR